MSVDFRSSVSPSPPSQVRIGIFSFLFFSQRDSALSNDRQTNRPADPQTAATAPHILSHGFRCDGGRGRGRGGGGEAPTEIKDLWPAIHQLFKNVLWLAGAIGTRVTTRTKLFLVT